MIKQRRLPLGFNATIIRSESPAEITVRPRVRYKIEQLFVVTSKPWTIGVHDLLVNGVSQIGAKKDTPAEDYAPIDDPNWEDSSTEWPDTKNRVSCKEALPGQAVTIQLFNRSKETVTVSVGAKGTATIEVEDAAQGAQAPTPIIESTAKS